MKKRWLLLLLAVAAGVLGWRWYDSHVDRSGWLRKDGETLYVDFHGRPYSGWLEADGCRYYLDAGHPATGWVELDGNRYLFDETFAQHFGWCETQQGKLYLGESGVALTGWQELDGSRYCFSPDGICLQGWQEIVGERYYFDKTGKMATGRLELPEGQYLLREDGTMVTGWAPDGKYFLPTGQMATDWQEIDGRLFCFQSDGTPITGWITRGEYRYYLTAEGAAVGANEIDGRQYFFTPKGICLLLINGFHTMPQDYEYDLVNITREILVDRSVEQPLLQLIAACEEATGRHCDLNCGYRDIGTQAAMREAMTQQYMAGGMDEGAARALAYASVAIPGQSEHQTGLAVDLTCGDEENWLMQHCWEYGFIVRYPEGKQAITHIANEFWHFRYVGREVAMDMRDSGLCLEEYLGAVS